MTRKQGPLTVVAVGVILLLASVGHHVQEIDEVGQLAGPLVALSLDAGTASVLIFVGWWLHHTDLAGVWKWSVAKWTALGAIAGGVIAGLTLAAQVIEGRTPPEPAFRVLVMTAAGGVLSFAAGYYTGGRKQ